MTSQISQEQARGVFKNSVNRDFKSNWKCFFKLDSSAILLIIANLIPLFGVLFLEWDLILILFLYWSESAIIGFYTIIKMMLAQGKILEKISLILFFIVHFGFFMLIHLIFILGVFTIVIGPLTWSEVYGILTNSFAQLIIPFTGLFISHGISFFKNFIGKKEYKAQATNYFFAKPYGRIFLMHFAILIGAFLTMILGNPIGMLLVLITLKIFIDIISHNIEHLGGIKIIKAK